MERIDGAGAADEQVGSTSHAAEPASDRPIVLTGFMGTGKTTVGAIVAARLGFELIDTDDVIEQRHGPIPEIFATGGEAAFRALEQDLARELAGRRSVVIATGGRFMLDPVSAAAIGHGAVVVCLSAPPDEIAARVLADRSSSGRPLRAEPDPAARIERLLAERRAGYSRFPQIETAGRRPEDVAADVIEIATSSPG